MTLSEVNPMFGLDFKNSGTYVLKIFSVILKAEMILFFIFRPKLYF